MRLVRDKDRRRLVCVVRIIPRRVPLPAPPEDEELTTEQGVPIRPDPDDWLFLLDASRPSARLAQFELALRAAGRREGAACYAADLST